jgi:outer membrane protein
MMEKRIYQGHIKVGKWFLLLYLFTFLPLSVSAQENNTFRFAFLSYEQALKSMPDYPIVQRKIANLQEQYQSETKRAEEEFNRKYEEFLEGRQDFPKSILQKRQTELEELMTKNIAFKENFREELAHAEKEALAPLRLRLSDLLSRIGRERGYAFIYDTDTKALPFLNIDYGEDINQLVTSLLNE